MIGQWLIQLVRDRSGATAIEYGLILAFIVIGLFAVVGGMGNMVTTTLGTASTTMSTANAAA
jgi:pilus assembly protein Flp/PilA